MLSLQPSTQAVALPPAKLPGSRYPLLHRCC
jgi:hypothetical protein